MFIQVKLLNGFRESLTYKVPDEWSNRDLTGSLIKVPIQKRFEFAYIEKTFAQLEGPVSYSIKSATEIDIIPTDPHFLPFLLKLSSYYVQDNLTFLKRLKRFLEEKEHEVPLVSTSPEDPHHTGVVLTTEQQYIVNELSKPISQGIYYPALLHGVTNSGKTEVYKRLIMHAWKEGKGSLLLFPEVSLAVQFSRLLQQQLPASLRLFSFHSATSVKEKRSLWNHLMANKPAVILGVHLPLLLPLPHLGLIIIDEEHDTGYQEKRHPKIHTKEAALLRAQCSSIPVLAGSATPSLHSLYNVEHKGWHLFELKKRFSGAFPRIEVVRLSTNTQRKQFWISTELEKAIREQLSKKEQTIIFLNRRGYSFFIQCASCGFVPHCIACDVSLTLHKDKTLRCHYCSYRSTIISICPSCKGDSFLKKGIGTQQVVTILEKLFPDARIARADMDATINKKNWIQTLTEFESGTIDILVGTQTITKGYHFPRVTLVGILWADVNLSIPQYNAAEVTLQQLIQVAGRAGRQSSDSKVIVQTMIDHPLFNYLNEIEYRSFYEQELKKREQVHYPPCTRFAEIECKHADEDILIKEAQQLVQALTKAALKAAKNLTILGPSQPPVSKIKNLHSRKIFIKADSIGAIIDVYNAIRRNHFRSSLYFTPNPLS